MKPRQFRIQSKEHASAIEKRFSELGINNPEECSYASWGREYPCDLILFSDGSSGYRSLHHKYEYEKATLDDLYDPDFLKPSRDELLEEAKRRYPIGTKFKVAHYPEITATVTSHEVGSNTFVENDGLYINFYAYGDGCVDMSSVYYDGQWAEIVDPNQELLDKAAKEYPVGTRFIDPYGATTKATCDPWVLEEFSKTKVVVREKGDGGVCYDGKKWMDKLQRVKVI